MSVYRISRKLWDSNSTVLNRLLYYALFQNCQRNFETPRKAGTADSPPAQSFIQPAQAALQTIVLFAIEGSIYTKNKI